MGAAQAEARACDARTRLAARERKRANRQHSQEAGQRATQWTLRESGQVSRFGHLLNNHTVLRAQIWTENSQHTIDMIPGGTDC